MNRRINKVASGVAREYELRSRMVTLDENNSQEQNADSLILPDNADCNNTCGPASSLESSGVAPCESHSTPIFKSKDSMKHTITITLPEAVWTAEIEPDKDIEGMIVTTFTTETSTDPLSYEVNSCSVADLESVIKCNLSQLVVKDKCGTLEGRFACRFDRDETETERRTREILCRLFKINAW